MTGFEPISSSVVCRLCPTVFNVVFKFVKLNFFRLSFCLENGFVVIKIYCQARISAKFSKLSFWKVKFCCEWINKMRFFVKLHWSFKRPKLNQKGMGSGGGRLYVSVTAFFSNDPTEVYFLQNVAWKDGEWSKSVRDWSIFQKVYCRDLWYSGKWKFLLAVEIDTKIIFLNFFHQVQRNLQSSTSLRILRPRTPVNKVGQSQLNLFHQLMHYYTRL